MILTKKQLKFYLLADKIMAEPETLPLFVKIIRNILPPPFCII